MVIPGRDSGTMISQKDADLARPVDPGSRDVVVWYRDDELAHQKDAERRHGKGNDQRLIGIDPAELPDDQIERHDNDIERNHDRAHD